MATSQARRAAKASAQGQRVLPKQTVSRARKAATRIEPVKEFDYRDRDIIIRLQQEGYWDTGESLDTPRETFSAAGAENYTTDLAEAGVPDVLINVVPYTAGTDNRSFTVYAARKSG